MPPFSRRQLLALSAGTFASLLADNAQAALGIRPASPGARPDPPIRPAAQRRQESSFNPLKERGIPLDKQTRNWSELNVKPYAKQDVPAYTRTRIILMNGIEVESTLFSHQFARNTTDVDVKRKLAEVRRTEQQQQKAVNWMIPGDEPTLEVVIGYEQVATDLTAAVARQEPDAYARQTYQFALLEDFDHLYRYANLLHLTKGKEAESIVDELTEIMPGRPTMYHHRHPYDSIRRSLNAQQADPISLLHALTVTAAEQQTMNYYMNVGNRPADALARGLYLEIAQVEEQHVSQYESLMDAAQTWPQKLLWHEYNECYLYHACLMDEELPRAKQLWEVHLAMEIEHLKKAADLVKRVDKRDPEEILPKQMPLGIHFHENKNYIRTVLGNQVWLTADGTEYAPMDQLPKDHRFYQYQRLVNAEVIPSEKVVERHAAEVGEDYRFESEGDHPVEAFRVARRD